MYIVYLLTVNRLHKLYCHYVNNINPGYSSFINSSRSQHIAAYIFQYLHNENLYGFLCLVLLQTFRLLFRFLYSRFLVDCYFGTVIWNMLFYRNRNTRNSSAKITTPPISSSQQTEVETGSGSKKRTGGGASSAKLEWLSPPCCFHSCIRDASLERRQLFS